MNPDRARLEQMLILKRTLMERRANDPLFLWEPTPKQVPFIEAVLAGTYHENWFIAANRSGKSDAGAYIGACLARFGGNPRVAYSSGGQVEVRDRATSGWVVSLDFPASRDIIQPKYFDNGFGAKGMGHPPFIPEREIQEWRIADQILKLKNGSIMGFKSCDSGRIKFQGADKDWVHYDEEPPKSIYEETVIRVSAGRKLRIFGTCTILPPEGMLGGVSWLYTDLIQSWQTGARKDVGIFGASIYDNPHLDPMEIKRLEGIYPPASVQQRIRLGGEWLPGLSGARAYPPFDRRIHVRPQGPPIPRRPLCWFWDFNVAPMVTGVGQRDGRLFRIYRELILEEGNIQEMCEMFRSAYPYHSAEILLYGDATGKGRNAQTGQSDYYTVLNGMRGYPAPLRMRVPESNPPVPDRINAVNRVLRDEYGASSIEIDPSCVEMIADLEQVLRGDRGGIKKTRNSHDPYYRRTHSTDGLGYWISWDCPITVGEMGLARPKVQIKTPSYSWVGGS